MKEKVSRAVYCKKVLDLVDQNKMSAKDAIILVMRQRYEVLLDKALEEHWDEIEPDAFETIAVEYLKYVDEAEKVESIRKKKEEAKRDKGAPVTETRLEMSTICRLFQHILKLIPGSRKHVPKKMLAQMVSRISGYDNGYAINYLSNPKDLNELRDVDLVNQMLQYLNIQEIS